ncbi:MAG: hypothetical protein FWD12_10165 [Alphaproteobacteria bacterium]|nr:hypothetical protein [Alphaproteobacteria bacterium]
MTDEALAAAVRGLDVETAIRALVNFAGRIHSAANDLEPADYILLRGAEHYSRAYTLDGAEVAVLDVQVFASHRLIKEDI